MKVLNERGQRLQRPLTPRGAWLRGLDLNQRPFHARQFHVFCRCVVLVPVSSCFGMLWAQNGSRQLVEPPVALRRDGMGDGATDGRLLVDGLIILAYVAAITAIGLYAGRREKSLNDYALGGRRVPWWAAMMEIGRAHV